MNVLYIVDKFPVFSQTFVFDEILNHIKNNIDVQVCVLQSSNDADFPMENCPKELQSRTNFLNLWSDRNIFTRLRLVLFGTLSAIRAGNALKVFRLWAGRNFNLREVMFGAVIARKFPSGGIIHCHFGNLGRIGLAATELSAARKTLFVTFHAFEMTTSWFLPLDRYYRAIFRSDAQLLPISDHWRSTLLNAGADPNKIATHHMGVKVPAIAEMHRRSADRTSALRIIQVGRMVDKKGHLVSVEALAQLKQRRPDIEFTCDFIGGGPLEPRIRARVCELGLTDTIRFLGPMQHEDVLTAVTASDIFLLPSVTAQDGDMEGIPVALMEAMVRNVPVVSTHHSGIPELVFPPPIAIIGAPGA